MGDNFYYFISNSGSYLKCITSNSCFSSHTFSSTSHLHFHPRSVYAARSCVDRSDVVGVCYKWKQKTSGARRYWRYIQLIKRLSCSTSGSGKISDCFYLFLITLIILPVQRTILSWQWQCLIFISAVRRTDMIKYPLCNDRKIIRNQTEYSGLTSTRPISGPPRVQDVTIFSRLFLTVCVTLAQPEQI